jgi:hypothetical protein
MVHATVGYCFTGSPEYGGEGVLIGLHRCQAFRVAQKKHKGADGNSYAKGDVITTDCNVTGTDIGTPSKPNYALKDLWEHILIPALERLVAPGGRCAGAMVVHQEDNAGPHKEGKYHEWLTAEFERRGWKLELQAPQVQAQSSLTPTLTLYTTMTLASRVPRILILYHRARTLTFWIFNCSRLCQNAIPSFCNSTITPRCSLFIFPLTILLTLTCTAP